MADAYLKNLASAFGEQFEGPDPTRLGGLYEYVEQALNGEAGDVQEASAYVARMREQISQAAREREAAFESRAEELSSQISAPIQRNLQALRSLEATLGELQQSLDMQNTDEAYGHLDALLEASTELKTSSDIIGGLARSDAPLCPRCGSAGPEDVCPECQLDRLIPDADASEEDFEQTVVSNEVRNVFQAYSAVVDGKAPLAALLATLEPLEASLSHTRSTARQAAMDDPGENFHRELLYLLKEALGGIERIRGVQDNLLTSELHAGWADLFRAAVSLHEILADMQESPATQDDADAEMLAHLEGDEP
jgi:hypothetical protein